MDTKLYVGNLAYQTTEEDLKNLFAQAGSVVSVNVIKDRDTGRSRGFGFVEMSSQAEAEKAVSMFNETMLNNRTLRVNIARPMEDRGGSRDRRGGGGGGGFGERRTGGGGFDRGGGRRR